MHATQAQRLYAAIRKSGKRGLTYLDLNLLAVSTSPHKRLSEGLAHLRDGERLDRVTRPDGRVAFVIKKDTPCQD